MAYRLVYWSGFIGSNRRHHIDDRKQHTNALVKHTTTYLEMLTTEHDDSRNVMLAVVAGFIQLPQSMRPRHAAAFFRN